MIWQPTILTITGLFALIVQMIYFLLDDRAPNHDDNDRFLKRNWHWAGGLIHIWMGFAIGMHYGWEWGLLMAGLTWFFFDGFINTYVLKREWWYIGTTAWLDCMQNAIGKLIHSDGRLISAILKSLLLAVSIFFLVKHIIYE